MSDHNTTSAADSAAPQDENQLIAERREKLKGLREAQAQGGGVAFPNDFQPTHHAASIQAAHAEQDAEALAQKTRRSSGLLAQLAGA